MPADTKAILRRWEDLKGMRLPYEATWQDIANYILPRRDFTIKRFPGELRDRRLLDATAMIANDRFAAMLFGFLVSPIMPFVRPDVEPALLQAGRSPRLDSAGQDFMERGATTMHHHFLRAKSGFTVALGEALTEFCAFGTGIVATMRRRGFGAWYQSRPLQSSWIAENADGQVDTLYYAFELPAYRVVEKWPAAAELKSIAAAMARPNGQGECAPIRLLHAVEPREGGRYGAAHAAKPYQSCVVVVEDKEIVEETGYDSFPFAVMRFAVKPGETYGYGPGHLAIGDARMLNAMMESVLRGAEMRVDPPIMAPLRMFPKALDRRPGAVNYYQASQLGLQTADQAVRPLQVAGDVPFGVEMVKEFRGQIEYAYYTDWMRLRENGNMTATEVTDRRDLRLRGMSPIVGRAERDGLGPIADRTFEINALEGMFGQPPASVAGLNVDWGYTGPMALAQMQSQKESIGLFAALAAQVAAFDPAGAKAADGEGLLRGFATATGLLPGSLRTHEDMDAIQQKQEQDAQAAQDAQNAQASMQAVRDGAQGVSSLAAAQGAFQGGGNGPLAGLANAA